MGASSIKGSYVLFACQFARDTYCAVPTSYAIPEFLVGPGWRFVAVLNRKRSRQPGFREKAAQAAIRRDGYYLFTAPPARNGSAPASEAHPAEPASCPRRDDPGTEVAEQSGPSTPAGPLLRCPRGERIQGQARSAEIEKAALMRSQGDGAPEWLDEHLHAQRPMLMLLT